jgi:GWxTD domain-containing protein
MRRVALVVALFVTTAAFAAQDPGAALGEAKSHLAAKQYVKAFDAAKAGLEAAAQIKDENERKAALTALNFYAAAAATGTGDTDAARGYIEEFLKLSPKTRRLDPSKFDPKFVALFGAIANPAGDDMWSSIYPGFSSMGQSTDANAVAMIDAAAVELLGTKAEKKEWRAVENGGNREAFLQSFWSKRDREPSTPQNEYRDLVARRIAFADVSFATGRDRGALSDRGRVFVLLGRPAFVRRRPINRDDRVSVIGTEVNTQVNGTMEHWAYTREQLPVAYSKETVTYRFVTQTGVGDNTLQKDDAFAMNALAKAAELSLKK